LTGYNAPLSNDDYGPKRKILLNSHLELNKYFEGVTEWNDQLIRARAEVLADRALRIWSYFGQEQSEMVSLSQSVSGTTPTGLGTFARIRISQARYESSHGVRFLGLSSRTYSGWGGQVRFWFGIRRSQLAFLRESDAAWLAFECGSSQKIVLFPFAKFQPFFARLRETEGSHWHVDLREEDGRLILHSRLRMNVLT
jgi:Protein of unknown function (DUF1524)